MKHGVLGRLLPLTIVAVAVLSEPACAEPPQACESLTGLKINNVNLLSATAVGSTADLPAHCRVLGYVRPAINFEIRLPVRNWNGSSTWPVAAVSAALSTATGLASPTSSRIRLPYYLARGGNEFHAAAQNTRTVRVIFVIA
jgi:hypothetical protein